MRRGSPAWLGWAAWVPVGLFVGLPVAGFAVASFRTGLGAMAAAFREESALHALKLSLGVGVGTALLGVFFGTAIALAGRTSRLTRVLADLPQTISPVVAGVMLFAVWRKEGGWLGSLSPVTILNAWPALLLASLFMTLPVVPRQLRILLDGDSGDAERAARTLGAGEGQILRRVTLPRLRPALLTGAALAFSRSLGEFGAAIVVSGNLIGETQTLTLWTAQEAGDVNLPGAYAGGWVLAFLSMAAFALARGLNRRA